MKIKDLFKELLAICVLVPLLHNFCSAGKITYNGVANQYKYNATNFGPLILNSRGGPIDYECCFSNFSGTSSFNNKTINLQFKKKGDSAYTTIKSFNSSVIINNECVNGTYNGNYMTDSFYITLYFPYVGSLNSYNTIYSCSFSGDLIFVEEDTNYYLSSYLSLLTGDSGGGDCDYSDYVSLTDYNICLSNLATATGNLQSCQSSISGYVNSLNNCSNNLNSCNTSLSSCLSANCPSGDSGTSWSALWINNIQHLGASNIYMTIPEEISWDYSYSNSGENMEIDVEGYNVDYDYINGVVDIQKYKPSGEDFTNIVSNLGLYLKILLFLVFAFILIKRIKKPFSSKLK